MQKNTWREQSRNDHAAISWVLTLRYLENRAPTLGNQAVLCLDFTVPNSCLVYICAGGESGMSLLYTISWSCVAMLRVITWEINSILSLSEFRVHRKIKEDKRYKMCWNQPYPSKTHDPALELSPLFLIVTACQIYC